MPDLQLTIQFCSMQPLIMHLRVLRDFHITPAHGGILFHKHESSKNGSSREYGTSAGVFLQIARVIRASNHAETRRFWALRGLSRLTFWCDEPLPMQVLPET